MDAYCPTISSTEIPDTWRILEELYLPREYKYICYPICCYDHVLQHDVRTPEVIRSTWGIHPTVSRWYILRELYDTRTIYVSCQILYDDTLSTWVLSTPRVISTSITCTTFFSSWSLSWWYRKTIYPWYDQYMVPSAVWYRSYSDLVIEIRMKHHGTHTPHTTKTWTHHPWEYRYTLITPRAMRYPPHTTQLGRDQSRDPWILETYVDVCRDRETSPWDVSHGHTLSYLWWWTLYHRGDRYRCETHPTIAPRLTKWLSLSCTPQIFPWEKISCHKKTPLTSLRGIWLFVQFL